MAIKEWMYLSIYSYLSAACVPATRSGGDKWGRICGTGGHSGAAVASSPTTDPTTMPSDRLSLRLGQLPHDVLAELAARLCSDSPALQAAT